MAFIQSPSIVTANLTLLVDPANSKSYDSRENLLQYSQQAHTAPWGLGNILNSGADSTAAPDGTLTADKLIENTSTSVYHYSSQTLTKPAAANTYTYSIYAKDAGRAVMGLRIESSGNGAVYAVNLSTGVVQLAAGVYGTSFTNAIGNVTAVGNGWYRMSLTVTTDAATSIFVQNYLYSTTAGSSVYTGDGVSGVYVWGAQLEISSSPQTYVPTTATAINRSITLSSGVSSTIASNFVNTNFSNGTFVFANTGYINNFSSAITSGGNSRTVCCFFKTTDTSYFRQCLVATRQEDTLNGWMFVINRSAAGNLTYGTIGYGTLEVAAGITINQWYFAAFTHDVPTNTGVLFLNGVNIGTQPVMGTDNVSNSNGSIGRETGSNLFSGNIGPVLVYDRALSNNEIRQNFNALRGRYGI